MTTEERRNTVTTLGSDGNEVMRKKRRRSATQQNNVQGINKNRQTDMQQSEANTYMPEVASAVDIDGRHSPTTQSMNDRMLFKEKKNRSRELSNSMALEE